MRQIKPAILLAVIASVCLSASLYLAFVAERRAPHDASVCTQDRYATNVSTTEGPVSIATAPPALSQTGGGAVQGNPAKTSTQSACDQWWNQIAWSAGLGGLSAFLFLYFLVSVATGRGHLLGLVIGADRKLSVSQLQLVTWTFVLLFVYPFLYVARALVQARAFTLIGPFPPPAPNILIAVGLGAFTAVAATGIATHAAGSNAGSAAPGGQPPWPSQPPAPMPSPSGPPAGTLQLRFRDLVTDAQGMPDFTKLQMLAWTAVAAALYFGNVMLTAHGFAVARTVGSGSQDPVFPDIPQALMWLMGFSQATYLGAKYLGGPTQPSAPAAPGTSTPS